MKLLIYSDLHTEITSFSIPKERLELADVVILAGDIGVGKQAATWIQKNVSETEVLWVWGNHEFYAGHIAATRLKAAKALEISPNIKILENSSIEIEGVRFLGCTLWTDCKLRKGEVDTFRAIQEMSSRMNDYKYIRTGVGYRRLRVADTIGMHIRSRNWLEEELEKEHSGPTVVITHHAPLKKCVNEAKAVDIYLDGAYASDLSELIHQYQPHLWINGHTHRKIDLVEGNTRCVSNPLGYHSYGEQTGFDPICIIEV